MTSPQNSAPSTQTTPRGRVFLSYGHDQACTTLVTRLAADLRSHGWECWLDKDRIEFGDEWRREITAGILHSDHMLAFLSGHSTRKPGVCRQEVAIALNARQCHVYTVLVEPLPKVTPPLLISQRQWLDMQHWADVSKRDPEAAETLYQKSLSEILRVLERNQSFAGEIDELQRWLQPLDSTADMIAAEDSFSGREWLLGDVGETREGGEAATNNEITGELEAWRISGSEQRVFWLAAGPGWGKSAVAARLAHGGRARIMAVHFCKYDRPNTRDAGRVFCTLAFQMATQLGEYRELLVKRCRDGLQLNTLNPSELFHELLANPLSLVIEGGRSAHDRHLLVVDALDEALDSHGRSDLVSLLAGEFDKLPHWLGLVVTSRPEAPIQRQFARHGLHLQSVEDPRNLADLRSYTTAWLQRLPLAPGAAVPALESILAAADGNFLYLRQLQHAIETGLLTVVQLSEPGQLPQGLSRLYECWFQHRFPDPAHYEQKIRPLLEFLLAAREPLPISLAARALAWDTYGARAVDELGSFCRKANDTLTLYHKSLRDWLSDPEAAGWDFVASEAEGHKRMASVLLQAYAAWQAAGAAFQSAAGWEQLGSTATPYALRHLPAHLASAGEPHARVGVLTDFALALRRCKPEILNSLLEDYREAVAASDQSVMNDWVDCIKTSTHLLRRGNDTWPAYKILLQIAMDHADESAITKAAEAWLETGGCDWLWLRRVNRPKSVERTGLLAVLEGHTGHVRGAELLPDGRLLTWASDGDLRLWDGVSGAPLCVLEDHANPINDLRVIQDGRVLYWSTDRSLRLLDSVTGVQLSVLEGHTRFVRGARLLADGRLLSWSADGTLRLWDGVTGAQLGVMKGHTGGVNGAWLLPSGRLLSWANDHTLRLWNGATGALLGVMEGHTDEVNGAQMLGDGRLLSWSRDGTLRLWDGVSGASLGVSEGHTDAVNGVQLLSDGRVLSWSWDGTLRLWDCVSGAQLRVMTGHTRVVRGAQPLPDGRFLSWSDDCTLRLWDGANGALLSVLEGHSHRVNDVSFLPDGRLLSWSDDGSLRFWDAFSGAPLGILQGHTGGVNGALLLPDGRVLSWSWDRSLRLWDKSRDTPLGEQNEHAGLIGGAQLLKDGRVVSWSMDRTLRLWDGISGAPLQVLKGHTDDVNGFQRLPDGRLLSWSDDATLRLWDGSTGDSLGVIEGHTHWVNGAQLLTDGRVLSWSGRYLSLWDEATGFQLNMLEGHTGFVDGAQLLPDGRVLSWSWDGTLRLWDGVAGAPLWVLAGHSERVRGALPLLDGRVLSWSDDCTLRLWDGASGALISVLEGHTHAVMGVLLLPDSRLLSWSLDGSLRLWAGANGAPLGVLEGHTRSVRGAQLLPDGCVVSCSYDATLRLWDLETCKEIRVLKQPWILNSEYPSAWEGSAEHDLAGATRVGDFWIQSYDKALIIADRKNHIHAQWQGPDATYSGYCENNIVAFAGKNLLALQLMMGNKPVPINSGKRAA